MTGIISYYHVSDIRKNLQNLLDGGAQKLQDVRDVGGGKLIASEKDPEGNLIGFIQMPKKPCIHSNINSADLTFRDGFFIRSGECVLQYLRVETGYFCLIK
jgi:hypothetical protein